MNIPKKISTATLLTCVMITPVANGLVYTHAQTVINNGDHSNQIAIVNEDKGVVNAKGETVCYSDQFLPSYNKDGYIVTSLDKARNSGYLAYVVVPSNFSSNVESINTQPTQSVLGYYIEDEAHANEAVMKIVQLEMNLNRDIGKLYVGSILNEFYQAQDNAEIVLNNSNINSEAISQLANTDFIRTIDLKPLELTKAPDGSGLVKDEETYFGPFNEAMEEARLEYNKQVNDLDQKKDDAQVQYEGLGLSSIKNNLSLDNEFYNQVQRFFYNDKDNEYIIYLSKKVEITPGPNDSFNLECSNDFLNDDNFQIFDKNGNYQKPGSGIVPKDIANQKAVNIYKDADGKMQVEIGKKTRGSNKENLTLKESVKQYLNGDNGIKEANNHILLQNSINYLDLLYFDVISKFVTDIVTDPSLATQAHFNQLIQIRLNKYGNNINTAINQFNQYSNIKINNIQDYINLRTGQYQKIAANYDFANHNLDALSTTIMSMLDTVENTYYSANESVNNEVIESGVVANNSRTGKEEDGIGQKYESSFKKFDSTIEETQNKINTYNGEVQNNINIDASAMDKIQLNTNQLASNFLPVKDFVQALKDNNTDVISAIGKVNSENSKLISDYQTQTNNDLQARVENLENVNNATSTDNKNLIGDFATKLRYSRTGNVPNKTVVDAMMAPLSVTNDGDVKGSLTVPMANKRDEEENQKSNVNPWVIGLGISTAVLASYIVGDAVFSRKKHK